MDRRKCYIGLLIFISITSICFGQTSKLLESDIQNKKRKALLMHISSNESNPPSKEYIYLERTNKDTLYEWQDSRRFYNVLCKDFFLTNGMSLHDSLIKEGFNSKLKQIDVSEKCRWSFEVISVDSSVAISKTYCVDGFPMYYQGVVKISFYYPDKEKKQDFIFKRSCIPKNWREPDNWLYAYFKTGLPVTYFPDCDIYMAHFDYSLVNCWCDVFSNEMYFYF